MNRNGRIKQLLIKLYKVKKNLVKEYSARDLAHFCELEKEIQIQQAYLDHE